MDMRAKRIGVAAALLAALAAPVNGQSLTQQVMTSLNDKEGTMSRTVANYAKGDTRVFGMFQIDSGTEPSYFGWLGTHRELEKGLELVAEAKKKNGGTVNFGAGLGYDVPMPERAKLNIHLLPLRYGGGFEKEVEISIFGKAGLPRRFYVEGFAEVDLPYNGKPETHAEFAFGRQVGKGSVEVIGAYNGKGASFRTGARYPIF